MPTKEKLMTDYKKMVSQKIAERPLNITSILNNFTSFMKQAHKKNGLIKLTRKMINKITSEQK